MHIYFILEVYVNIYIYIYIPPPFRKWRNLELKRHISSSTAIHRQLVVSFEREIYVDSTQYDPEESFQRFRNNRWAKITHILAIFHSPGQFFFWGATQASTQHHDGDSPGDPPLGRSIRLQSTSRRQLSPVSRNYPMASRHDSVRSMTVVQTRFFGVIFRPSFLFSHLRTPWASRITVKIWDPTHKIPRIPKSWKKRRKKRTLLMFYTNWSSFTYWMEEVFIYIYIYWPIITATNTHEQFSKKPSRKFYRKQKCDTND